MVLNNNNIVVLSANCRGLKSKLKRADVLHYLSDLNSNIICLQDTHWMTKDEPDIRSIWNHPCYVHGFSNNSRGVAILLSKNFDCQVLSYFSDSVGNLQTLDIKISNDITFKIINIYSSLYRYGITYKCGSSIN